MPLIEKSHEEKTRLGRYLGIVLIFIVSIFSLFFVALSFLTLFGSTCRNLELLTHLRVQLLLPLLAIFPVLLFMRSRIILMLVAVALSIHLFDIAPLYLPHHKSAPVATVRILSINLNCGNENFSGVQKLIENEDADIVCLQELAPAMGDALRANLSTYPYRFVEAREGYFGIGIFSKYDLMEQQKLKLCPDDILTLRCQRIDSFKHIGEVSHWI